MIKKIVVNSILIGSLSLVSLIVSNTSVSANDDRDVTPEELAKIEDVVTAQGCSLDDDDGNFDLEKQLYEIDVICDGKGYEMIIDENFNFVSKTEDN
ncbi:MAG: hypothetical protein ACRC2J_04405 [Microcoleaceae cyanobacterium]